MIKKTLMTFILLFAQPVNSVPYEEATNDDVGITSVLKTHKELCIVLVDVNKFYVQLYDKYKGQVSKEKLGWG